MRWKLVVVFGGLIIALCISGTVGYNMWFKAELPHVQYDGFTFVKASETWGTSQFTHTQLGKHYEPASPSTVIDGAVVYVPILPPVSGTAATAVLGDIILKRHGKFVRYKLKQP